MKVLTRDARGFPVWDEVQHQDPTPPPPPQPRTALPSWVPLAVAIALVIAQQLSVSLHALPPSQPVTIALIVVTALTAILPQVEALLSQQQAHVERLAALRRWMGE